VSAESDWRCFCPEAVVLVVFLESFMLIHLPARKLKIRVCDVYSRFLVQMKKYLIIDIKCIPTSASLQSAFGNSYCDFLSYDSV
jgi:hypothetical protein